VISGPQTWRSWLFKMVDSMPRLNFCGAQVLLVLQVLTKLLRCYRVATGRRIRSLSLSPGSDATV
jgi:hypothetical protein